MIPIQQAVIAEASGSRVGRGMGAYEAAVLLGGLVGAPAAGVLHDAGRGRSPASWRPPCSSPPVGPVGPAGGGGGAGPGSDDIRDADRGTGPAFLYGAGRIWTIVLAVDVAWTLVTARRKT